jgi:hypothetical protein
VTRDGDWIRRWANAEAFYEERDHRTRLEVEHLHRYVNTPVEISLAAEAATSPTRQRIVLLAANLTARWARNVRIVVPHVELAPPLRVHGDTTLAARVAREMRDADPFGNHAIGEVRSVAAETIRLRVGAGSDPFLTGADYIVDATGWSALGQRVSTGLTCQRPEATIAAAALAAAIGAGDLFKRAIGHPEDRWLGTINWCTWEQKLRKDWTPCAHAVPEITDLGNLLLAGVGAIGSALIYILSLSLIRGRITLLDRDCIDTTNLNRSPLFTARDAALGLLKTVAGQTFLNGTGLRITRVDGTWREHGAAVSQQPFDVWVSLTNEDGAWAEIPFQLPPVVIHGTTTSGWGICAGRHLPRVDDCTACRLPRPMAEFRGPCAEGDVSDAPRQQPVRASLPFLSTAAAALVASELLKLQEGGVTSGLPNHVSADLAFGLPTIVGLRLTSNPTCRGCQMSRLPLWTDRGGRSRYAQLSA